MFKHHKYCVIEISGLLVGMEDASGLLNVYLLDGADGSTARDADDKSKRVRILDPALIEFICREIQRSESGCRFSCPAQVAGPVGVDGDEIHLSYVSQAFIHDKDRLLKYEPH